VDLSVTYEGPCLEEVLARVRDELGADATIVEARRRRKGGVAGFFAREWFEVIAVAGDAGGGGSEGPAVAEPRAAAPPVEPSPASEADPLLALVDAADAAERPTAPDADRLRVNGRALLAASRRGFRADSTPTGAGDQASAVDVVDDRVVDDTVAMPVRPSPPRVIRGEALAPLLDRLATRARPAPWPSAPAVVAVVGDLTAAKQVGAALAPRFGVDPDGVAVAAQITPAGVPRWLRLDDPGAAAVRAGAWRARGRPAVVAVELVPGADGHAAAAAVLAALAPDQIRLVAPAWRDPTELELKVAALGGVDVVDLVELDQADDPEAFLDGDHPVGSLDGRPASPELWAAALLAARSARRG
jgi:hypothetical protein